MESVDFLHPTHECDLVMKGGITSGIVYPPAVLVLARKYRFHSIGGASAGAIAAATAAAAEFGREHDGFATLQRYSEWLGREDNLLNLFRPAPEARGLMETLLALTEQKRGGSRRRMLLHVARSLLRHDRSHGSKLGAAGGASLAWALARLAGGSVGGTGMLPVALLAGSGALVGGLAGGIAGLKEIITGHVQRNFFGMCSGHDADGVPSRVPALTDWLHASINEIAGRSPDGPPLTFRDLNEKGITLRMVSSNLSHRRPYHLPLQQNIFLFQEAEMRRLFPDPVVDHMVTHQHVTNRVSLADVPGFHYLPSGDELPVVVATRMSMSFPFLLSAVPLYTVRTDAFRKERLSREDLQLNLFSDGGISSNFPIHFFDSWLPERPTFGITLTTLPPEALRETGGETTVTGAYLSSVSDEGDSPSPPVEREAVLLPPANRALSPLWEPIAGFGKFVSAIFSTAQNYRDNTQSMLPSYRDRVVQVELAETEGGLNLAMTPETIAAVMQKGRAAGEALRDDFDFDHHRWVRFQVLMAELEERLHEMQQTYKDADYPALIRRAGVATQDGFPYPRSGPWTAEALRRLEELQALVERWQQEDREWQRSHAAWQQRSFFDHDSPRPEPVLRVTPDV